MLFQSLFFVIKTKHSSKKLQEQYPKWPDLMLLMCDFIDPLSFIHNLFTKVLYVSIFVYLFQFVLHIMIT